MAKPNIPEAAKRLKGNSSEFLSEIANETAETQKQYLAEFKAESEKLKAEERVGQLGIPLHQVYNRSEKIIKDTIQLDPNTVNEVIVPTPEEIDSNLAPINDLIEEHAAGLTESEQISLEAVATDEKSSLGYKILDVPGALERYNTIVQKQTDKKLDDYARSFEEQTTIPFDSLDQRERLAHEAYVRTKVREKYAARLLLNIDVSADAYGSISEEEYTPFEPTSEQLESLRLYAVEESLNDIDDIYGYGIRATVNKILKPTLLLSEESSDQDVQSAINRVQLYGVSALYDPEQSLQKQRDDLAQAINILKQRAPEQSQALDLDPGSFDASYIPEQVMEDKTAIASAASGDSNIISQMYRQYDALDALREDANDEELLSINAAIKYLVINLEPLEADTVIREYVDPNAAVARAPAIDASAPPSIQETAGEKFPSVVEIQPNMTATEDISYFQRLLPATEESEALLLINQELEGLNAQVDNLKAPRDPKRTELLFDIFALEELQSNLNQIESDLTFEEQLQKLVTTENIYLFNEFSKAFPNIDMDVWKAGYNEDETKDLVTLLLALRPGVKQAGNIASDVNVAWDPIRTDADFIKALEEDNLDAAMNLFDKTKVEELPQYLTHQLNPKHFSTKELQTLTLKELYEKSKETDNPIIEIEVLKRADRIRNTFIRSRYATTAFDMVQDAVLTTTYNPLDKTVMVRPNNVMSVMNALGVPKEAYEVLDPEWVAYIANTAILANPALLPFVYAPDVGRMIDRFDGVLGQGGIKEDLLYNMGNTLWYVPRDEREQRINTTISYLRSQNLEQFASLNALEQFTQDNFNGVGPEQIFDEHSIKLLLGTDRYTQTFAGIPYKPSYGMPISFQESMLKSNQNYTPIFDYTKSDTSDRVIAAQVVSPEGAMGYHRLMAEASGYSPGSPGYTFAQNIGMLSDMNRDPIDPLMAGVGKSIGVVAKGAKALQTVRKMSKASDVVPKGIIQKARALVPSKPALSEAFEVLTIQTSVSDNTLGVFGRAYREMTTPYAKAEQPKTLTNFIDDTMRTTVSSIERPTPKGTASSVLGRSAIYALGSVVLGPEAIAQYAFESGLRGAASGALMRKGSLTVFDGLNVNNRLESTIAGALEGVVGWREWSNYTMAKNFLESTPEGMSGKVGRVFADSSFYPSSDMLLRQYRFINILNEHKTGQSVFNVNDNNVGQSIAHFEAYFNKLGIDPIVARDAYERALIGQLPELLDVMKAFEDDATLKIALDEAKSSGFYKTLTDNGTEAEAEALIKLMAPFMKLNDMSFTDIMIQTSAKVIGGDPKKSLLRTLSTKNQDKEFTVQDFNLLPQNQKRLLMLTGLKPVAGADSKLTASQLKDALEARLSSIVNTVQNLNGTITLEMLIKGVGKEDYTKVDVSVRFLDERTKAEVSFKTPKDLNEPTIIGEVIRHMADEYSDVQSLIFKGYDNAKAFQSTKTRRLSISDNLVTKVDNGIEVKLDTTRRHLKSTGLAKQVAPVLKQIKGKYKQGVKKETAQSIQDDLVTARNQRMKLKQTIDKQYEDTFLTPDDLNKIDIGLETNDDTFFNSLPENKKEAATYYRDNPNERETAKQQVDNLYTRRQVRIKEAESKVKDLESKYTQMGGDLESVPEKTAAEARSEVAESMQTEDKTLMATDIDAIVKAQKSAQFIKVNDDNVLIFRGPANGNIQVKMFEDASGNEVVILQKIGTTNIDNLITASEDLFKAEPGVKQEAANALASQMARSGAAQDLAEITSNARQNLNAMVQHSIENGQTLAWPVAMDLVVGESILVELANKLGTDKFNSRVETIVMHEDVPYRLVNMDVMSAAKRSRKEPTISGDEYYVGLKGLKAKSKEEVPQSIFKWLEIPKEADLSTIRKIIKQNLTTIRQGIDQTALGQTSSQLGQNIELLKETLQRFVVAKDKFNIDMSAQIAEYTKMIEALQRAKETITGNGNGTPLQIQLDGKTYKVNFKVTSEQVMQYDMTGIDILSSAELSPIVNALVRRAARYDSVDNVRFVRTMDNGLESFTTANEIKEGIFKRWDNAESITDEMRESVPSTGRLFAKPRELSNMSVMREYSSLSGNTSKNSITRQDAAKARDLVESTKVDGEAVPLASMQLKNAKVSQQQVGAVPFGRSITVNEVLFALHDQHVQHIVIADSSKPGISKSNINVSEKIFGSSQANGFEQIGFDTFADVEMQDGSVNTMQISTARYIETQPTFPTQRVFDIPNIDQQLKALVDSKEPTIITNGPYSAYEGAEAIASILRNGKIRSKIKKLVPEDKLDTPVKIQIATPGDLFTFDITFREIISEIGYDQKSIVSRTAEAINASKSNTASINIKQDFVTQLRDIYLEETRNILSNIFQKQVTIKGYDDVKNGLTIEEPTFYRDRRFTKRNQRNTELIGNYTFDFIQRDAISNFIDAIGGRRVKDERFTGKGRKLKSKAARPQIPRRQTELIDVNTGQSISGPTEPKLTSQAQRLDEAQLLERLKQELLAAPDPNTTRLSYTTRIASRGTKTPFHSIALTALEDAYIPYIEKNLINFEELKLLLFSDKPEEDILDVVFHLSSIMNHHLNKIVTKQMKPSDVFSSYMAAVYSQQLGEVKKTKFIEGLIELEKGKFPKGAAKYIPRQYVNKIQEIILTQFPNERLSQMIGPEWQKIREEYQIQTGISNTQLTQRQLVNSFEFFQGKKGEEVIKTEVMPLMWLHSAEGFAFKAKLDQAVEYYRAQKKAGTDLDTIFNNLQDAGTIEFIEEKLVTPYMMRTIFGRSNVRWVSGEKIIEMMASAMDKFDEITPENISQSTNLESVYDDLLKLTLKMPGLGDVKAPFMLSLLGLGYKTTMDSRQVNALFGTFMSKDARAVGRRPSAKDTINTAQREAAEAARTKSGRDPYSKMQEITDSMSEFAPKKASATSASSPLFKALQGKIKALEVEFRGYLIEKEDKLNSHSVAVDPRVLPYVLHQLIWGRIDDMSPEEIVQVNMHATLGTKPDLDQYIVNLVANKDEMPQPFIREIEASIEGQTLSSEQANYLMFELLKSENPDFVSLGKEVEIYIVNVLEESVLNVSPSSISSLSPTLVDTLDKLRSGKSSFQLEDGQPLIFLDDDASLKTIIHENGHLLELLLGDDHYQKIAADLDHGVTSDEKRVLTRKGQEQFANAIESYFIYGDKNIPPAIQEATPTLSSQLAKIFRLGGQRTDASANAVRAASEVLEPPKASLKTSLIDIYIDVKYGDNTELKIGEPVSKRPEVREQKTVAGTEARTDVASAQTKEARLTKGLTQQSVIRDLLPSRWYTHATPAEARDADAIFINKIKEEGLDVVETAAKIEAMRFATNFADDQIISEFVAMTPKSIARKSQVDGIARRTKNRLEEIIGASAETLSTKIKVDEEAPLYLNYSNNFSAQTMPYVLFQDIQVNPNDVLQHIKDLQQGPIKNNISDRLMRDLAEGKSPRIYLHEMEAIKNTIIDNEMPNAQRRNRALEAAPRNIVEALVGVLTQVDFFKSTTDTLSDYFSVNNELENLVTPEFEEALLAMKSRSKDAESILKQIFIDAKNNLRPGHRTIQQILREARRMINPPISLTDATVIQQLSKRMKALSAETVSNDPKLNSLFIGNLNESTVSKIKDKLTDEQQVLLAPDLEQLDQYIKLTPEDKARSGRLKFLVEESTVRIFNELIQQDSTLNKPLVIEDYIGNSPLLTQLQGLLTRQVDTITTQRERDVVNRLQTLKKEELISVDKRRETEFLIIELFDIVEKRKNLIRRRGKLILESLDAQTSNLTDEQFLTAYTLFYSGRFATEDFDVVSIMRSSEKYSVGDPPNGVSWTGNDIYLIANQMGYISEVGPGAKLAISTEALQEVFKALKVKKGDSPNIANASDLDNYSAEDLVSIANHLFSGVSSTTQQKSLLAYAKNLGGFKDLSITPNITSTTPGSDAAGVYLEMLARLIAEDIHLDLSERLYDVYEAGNMQPLLEAGMNKLGLDPLKERHVFKDEVTDKLSQLIQGGDVVITTDNGVVPLNARQKVVRDIARQIQDSSGFGIREQAQSIVEMILPDGSKMIVHEEVSVLFEKLMSDYTPIGKAIKRKGEKGDSLWDMTRRQFQEADRLMKASRAQEELTEVLTAQSKKYQAELKVLEEEIKTLKEQLKKEKLTPKNYEDKMKEVLYQHNNVKNKQQQIELFKDDPSNDFSRLLEIEPSLFKSFLNNSIYLAEAVGLHLYQEGKRRGFVEGIKDDFKESFGMKQSLFNMYLNETDTATRVQILNEVYTDTVFIKNQTSINDYKEFMDSKYFGAFGAQASQLMKAAFQMFLQLFSDLATPNQGAIRLFKQAVTTGFFAPNLAYFFGNFIGGISQLQLGRGITGIMKIGGSIARNPLFYGHVLRRVTFNSRTQVPSKSVLITKDGMLYTPNMFANMMTEYSVGSSFVTAELGRKVQQEVLSDEMWKNSSLGRLNPIRGALHATEVYHSKFFMGAAEALDNIYRIGLFMEQVEDGISPSVAANEVRRVMFDYSDLSEFENKVGRFVFTFYSFMRKNTGLILYELINNPQRVRGQMRFIQQSLNSNVQEGYSEYAISEFYQSRIAIMPGTPIYKFLQNEYGAYVIDTQTFARNRRIYDAAKTRIDNIIYNESYNLSENQKLTRHLLDLYQVNTPKEAYDIFNYHMEIDRDRITDKDVAVILGYLNQNNDVDVKRFGEDYNLIEYDKAKRKAVFQLHSDTFQSKMYFLPAVNAPDGLVVLKGLMRLASTQINPSEADDAAQLALINVNPFLASIFYVPASGLTTFGQRDVKTHRTIPKELVDLPGMGIFFRLPNEDGGAEQKPFLLTPIRLNYPSRSPRSIQTRMHSYDTSYEFETPQDALRFIHYTNMFSMLPSFGRSEKITLITADYIHMLFEENPDLKPPPGMTSQEYFAELIGLRHSPIKTIESQMGQGIRDYEDVLRQYDDKYLRLETTVQSNREIQQLLEQERYYSGE